MNPASPGQAARRAYKQICNKHNLKGTKCKITFSLRETTRGSSKKVYGPYAGSMKNSKNLVYSKEMEKKLLLTMNPLLKMSKK